MVYRGVKRSLLTMLFLGVLVPACLAQPPGCMDDMDCEYHSFCDRRVFRCKQCVVCEHFNRLNNSQLACLKSVTDHCGDCLPGYTENKNGLACGLPETSGGGQGSTGTGLWIWIIGVIVLLVFSSAVVALYCYRKNLRARCRHFGRPTNQRNPSAPPYEYTSPDKEIMFPPPYNGYNNSNSNVLPESPPPYPPENTAIPIARTTVAGEFGSRDTQQDVGARPFNPPHYIRPGDFSIVNAPTVAGNEVVPFLPTDVPMPLQTTLPEVVEETVRNRNSEDSTGSQERNSTFPELLGGNPSIQINILQSNTNVHKR